MKKGKSLILFLVILGGCITGFYFLIDGCLSKYDSYGVVDWPAFNNEKTEMVFVKVYNKTVSYKKNGGSTSKSYSSRYYLTKVNIQTGEIIQEEDLIHHSDLKNYQITTYGGYNETLWVNVNGIKGYDMNTLKEIINEEMILEKNPFLKGKLPDGHLLKSNVPNGSIDFKALDAEEYRLDLKTLVAKPYKIDHSFEYYESSFDRIDNFCINKDTFNTNYFCIEENSDRISKEAEELISSNFHQNISDIKYEFFKGEYEIMDHAHYRYLIKNIKPLGDKYLKGNFLADINTRMAIHLKNPDGYIIVFRDIIGNNGKVIFRRIDLDNNKIWETNLNLTDKISFVSKAGKYVICIGNKDPNEHNFIGVPTVLILDTENGNTKEVIISK